VGYKAIIEAQDEAAAYLVRQIGSEPDEHGENVVLAGRCLADVGRGLVPDDCWEEVVEKLIPVMQDLATDGRPNAPSRVPVPTRYGAAEILDRLGWLPDDLNAWVEVRIPNPKPQAPNRVYVARYPVTNVQFTLFKDARGYEEQGRRWWSDEGWEWRTEKHSGYRGEGPVPQPEYWDHPRFGKSRRGYPVVGISWYEANAYCAWLSELLERHQAGEELEPAHRNLIAGLPGAAAVVRLPTEAEWVAAAGDGDEYPWGPNFDESRANTSEGGIGGTTPVGMYLAGKSDPHGVWDMAGNVWEWMASDEIVKPWRGGSWSDGQWGARVRERCGSDPGYSTSGVGFRVCASPARSGF